MISLVRSAAILTLALTAGGSGLALAGQFGDYKPQGLLSDYTKLKPEGA